MQKSISISSVAELRRLFASNGVGTILIKELAPKQDNEKNQIYFGAGLSSVTNVFPAEISYRSGSTSVRKRKSKSGQPKLEAVLDFFWIDRNGELSRAPNTRIIDYFQYPEVRLSGFLKGCKRAPDCLRRKFQAKYGRRVLAIGATSDGRTLGFVLNEVEDPFARRLPELPVFEPVPLFRVVSTVGLVGANPRDQLVSELKDIVAGGWHKSVRLLPRANKPIPFSGRQGGGYTLEALLGVASNSAQHPDKYGHEIKAFSAKGSRITLMTPSGDLGLRGKLGFSKFIEKYGHKAKRSGDERRRFTGTHKIGKLCTTSNLRMELVGYDTATGQPSDGTAVEVRLIDCKGRVAVAWSLGKLASAWNKKHAAAAYLSYTSRLLSATEDVATEPKHKNAYKFGNFVLVGEGTNVFRLLRAIAAGLVIYDPADEFAEDGSTPAKERPQWRILRSKLRTAMEVLYEKVHECALA